MLNNAFVDFPSDAWLPSSVEHKKLITISSWGNISIATPSSIGGCELRRSACFGRQNVVAFTRCKSLSHTFFKSNHHKLNHYEGTCWAWPPDKRCLVEVDGWHWLFLLTADAGSTRADSMVMMVVNVIVCMCGVTCLHALSLDRSALLIYFLRILTTMCGSETE